MNSSKAARRARTFSRSRSCLRATRASSPGASALCSLSCVAFAFPRAARGAALRCPPNGSASNARSNSPSAFTAASIRASSRCPCAKAYRSDSSAQTIRFESSSDVVWSRSTAHSLRSGGTRHNKIAALPLGGPPKEQIHLLDSYEHTTPDARALRRDVALEHQQAQPGHVAWGVAVRSIVSSRSPSKMRRSNCSLDSGK